MKTSTLKALLMGSALSTIAAFAPGIYAAETDNAESSSREDAMARCTEMMGNCASEDCGAMDCCATEEGGSVGASAAHSDDNATEQQRSDTLREHGIVDRF